MVLDLCWGLCFWCSRLGGLCVSEELGGRSFHLEHIKKQTHHPRCVRKPGCSHGPSQADNSCERPRRPADPVTSGCQTAEGWPAGCGGCSRDRVNCCHATPCWTCPPCTALWVLDVPSLHSIVGAGCAPFVRPCGCCMCPPCTAS